MTHYDWATLYSELEGCDKCRLAEKRTNIVIGDGDPKADIMFIGEGPGHDEDIAGLPFVGRAGQLLDKMMAAIGLDRTKAYIANIVKCRPPQNRTPESDECNACMGYLRAQVALVRPKVIVLLGSTAARAILDENARITRDRGKWINRNGVWIIATYHPAALLRDESKKREAWEDMKLVRDKLSELKGDKGGA